MGGTIGALLTWAAAGCAGGGAGGHRSGGAAWSTAKGTLEALPAVPRRTRRYATLRKRTTGQDRA